MPYLDNYLTKIRARGNIYLANSISTTAKEIGDKYLNTFTFMSHTIGLLFGNVQSGKTAQVFGIISQATDLGFPLFIILTTDNVALQQQTISRVNQDLDNYCICDETDSKIFENNNLEKPTIVVLKKNSRILKLWTNILKSSGYTKGNPIFIIDDEGDASSINTEVNKNTESTINKYLNLIKNEASSSLYLQVTGTPQAIILQSFNSGWHPLFIYYFRPGLEYVGGDFFFPNTSEKPDCISFLEEQKDPILNVVIRHITVSSIMFFVGAKVSNCLFHPSVRVAMHSKLANEINSKLLWCNEHIDTEFKYEMQKIYHQLTPSKYEKKSFESIFSLAQNLLQSKSINIIIMNGKNEIQCNQYEIGCNLIIGGNTLGRGITFPNLQTIYYTRASKKPQADTMWQHSRMFGYDRDKGMMKIYIDKNLYKLFADINSTNNAIIAQIEKGIANVKVYYPKNLKPTRSNVLDKKYMLYVSGGTNYYPQNLDNNSIESISNILKQFDSTEDYYQVNLRLIKEILLHIVPSADFQLNSFISIIDTILSESPTKQAILIVRRNRNITQGTGALLSPNDWTLGAKFKDKIVLTMYQVIGSKGWIKKDLWVPNIKLPHNIIYYDICKA